MNRVQEEMDRNEQIITNPFIMFVTYMYINSLYNILQILSVFFKEDGYQVSKTASFSSVR